MKLIFALVLSAVVQLPPRASLPPRGTLPRVAQQVPRPPICPDAPHCLPGGELVCDASCRCSCQYPVQ